MVLVELGTLVIEVLSAFPIGSWLCCTRCGHMLVNISMLMSAISSSLFAPKSMTTNQFGFDFDFGSRFGCWVLGFGFWVLGFGFWVLGFGFWVLGFGFWVLGFGFWVLGFGFWVLGFGFWFGLCVSVVCLGLGCVFVCSCVCAFVRFLRSYNICSRFFPLDLCRPGLLFSLVPLFRKWLCVKLTQISCSWSSKSLTRSFWKEWLETSLCTKLYLPTALEREEGLQFERRATSGKMYQRMSTLRTTQ